MPRSPYILQRDEKTYCPKCGASVDMLCRNDGKHYGWPWFYICWQCKLVAHVGKGEVLRDDGQTNHNH